MMFRRNYKFIIAGCLVFPLWIARASFASPLSEWKDAKAYKPRPVLLLHGFNSSPAVWNPVITGLAKWFSKYSTAGPYLETIDFQDYEGSVDTYPDGRQGWADRLQIKVDDLLSNAKYGFYTNKLNFICHSMGGLAAREFLTNPKYSSGSVDMLILLGVPNLGSSLSILGKSIASNYKVGSMMNTQIPTVFTTFRDITDQTATYLWGIESEASEALTDMSPGSNFLNALNNRPQPAEVKYYGIYGIIGHFLNKLYFKNFYGGDGIVSKESQVGGGKIIFRDIPQQITAFHVVEPSVSITGDNPLLKFLDSDIPEFQITSPASGTEIFENSIRIQGRVYKEYFPADSTLIINVSRQEGGYNPPVQTSFLKPSDLWIPNNLDSPVAEFDEAVNFPESGTYKISLQVQNPAGKTSDIKDIWVKVNSVEGTNIIVHCHNPEGKEIASIRGMAQNSVKIYDGDTLIGYGAYNAATHNAAIPISSGGHVIKAEFNGMAKEQAVIVNPNETKIITFMFERTEFNHKEFLDSIGSVYRSRTYSNGGYGDYMFYIEDLCPDRIIPYISDNSALHTTNVIVTSTAYCSMNISGSGVSVTVGANNSVEYLPSPATNYYFYTFTIHGFWADQWNGQHASYAVAIPGLYSSAFTNWFVQKNGGDTSGKCHFFLSQFAQVTAELINSAGYSLKAISASGANGEIYLNAPHHFNDWNGTTVQASGSGVFSNDKAWVTSVPYDLTGSAV